MIDDITIILTFFLIFYENLPSIYHFHWRLEFHYSFLLYSWTDFLCYICYTFNIGDSHVSRNYQYRSLQSHFY